MNTWKKNAENLIVEHLFYIISIATNNKTPQIFFHCVDSQGTIRDFRVGSCDFTLTFVKFENFIIIDLKRNIKWDLTHQIVSLFQKGTWYANPELSYHF